MECFVEVKVKDIESNILQLHKSFGLYTYSKLIEGENIHDDIIRQGNGIIIPYDKSTYCVVTCFHLIGDHFDQLNVFITKETEKEKIDVTYVGSFPLLDIAVLRVNGSIDFKPSHSDKSKHVIVFDSNKIQKKYYVENDKIVYYNPFMRDWECYQFPFLRIQLHDMDTITNFHGFSGSGIFDNNTLCGMIYAHKVCVYTDKQIQYLDAIPEDILMLYIQRILNKDIVLFSFSFRKFELAKYIDEKTDKEYKCIVYSNDEDKQSFIIKVNDNSLDEDGKMSCCLRSSYRIFPDVFIMLNNLHSIVFEYIIVKQNKKKQTETKQTIVTETVPYNEKTNKVFLYCNGNLFTNLTFNKYHVYGLNDITEQHIEIISQKQIIVSDIFSTVSLLHKFILNKIMNRKKKIKTITITIIDSTGQTFDRDIIL